MSDLPAIVNYLTRKYRPQAILFHGSRLVGDAVDHSDYDLTLLFDAETVLESETYGGCILDISAELRDLDVLKSWDVPTWPLDVVYDANGFGAALAKRTKAAYDAGPSRQTDEDKERRAGWLDWRLKKLALRDDEMLRWLQAGDIVDRLPRYWCEKRGEWTQSRHRLLKKIEAEDPAFYAHMRGLFGPDGVTHGKALAQMLFGQD